MRKLISTFIVCLLVACATQVQESVVDEVQRIYDVAAKAYSNHEEGETDVDLDEKYCSSDWNKTVEAVGEKDRKLGDDEIGFFEADYWVMGQDYQDYYASDFKLCPTETDADHAQVELTLHNCGSETRVRVEMVKEKGVWKIDNFIDLKNDFDWKREMKAYLEAK